LKTELTREATSSNYIKIKHTMIFGF